MKSEERKQKFITLLEQLLLKCKGVKGKLAESLSIKPSRLTGWLKGEVDPASLEISVFSNIANCANLSVDQLAQELGMTNFNSQTESLNKFQDLILDLLSNQTQEQLAQKLGISRGTINAWISSERAVSPAKIPVKTIVSLAQQKGWTVEGLLAYVNSNHSKEFEENLFLKLQSDITQLSFSFQLKLLIWQAQEFEQNLKTLEKIFRKRCQNKLSDNRKVLFIIDNEDLSSAAHQISYIDEYTLFKLENISLTTILKLPKHLADFDLLIFDISIKNFNLFDFISDISFNSDIVIFTSQDLEAEVRAKLRNKVTDIVVKPIDWQELKNKSYF